MNKNRCVQIPIEIAEEYQKVAEERGMKTAQLVRHTLKNALGESKNDSAIASSLIHLLNQVKANKEFLSSSEYSSLMNDINNLIKLCN